MLGFFLFVCFGFGFFYIWQSSLVLIKVKKFPMWKVAFAKTSPTMCESLRLREGDFCEEVATLLTLRKVLRGEGELAHMNMLGISVMSSQVGPAEDIISWQKTHYSSLKLEIAI